MATEWSPARSQVSQVQQSTSMEFAGLKEHLERALAKQMEDTTAKLSGEVGALLAHHSGDVRRAPVRQCESPWRRPNRSLRTSHSIRPGDGDELTAHDA